MYLKYIKRYCIWEMFKLKDVYWDKLFNILKYMFFKEPLATIGRRFFLYVFVKYLN